MKNSTFPTMLKLAAVTAALAFQGAAFAATPDATTATAPAAAAATTQTAPATASTRDGKMGHSHKRMGHHHQRSAAMWVPGYGPLSEDAVKGLSLNESQTKLLADAQTVQKDSRTAMRDAMKTERTTRQEQLKAGKIDPHAALKDVAAKQQKAQEARQEINQKWLAVWDSLDAAQQKKVATAFSERAEKMGSRTHKSHHRGNVQTEKSAS